MKFLQDLKLGYRSYFDAIKFIKTHKLWYYFIFPIILFLGIYYLGFVFQELKYNIKIEEDTGLIAKIWLMFLRSLYAFLAVIMFSFMRYVLIILLSPILSIVSERVERILTGNSYKFNLKQLLKDIKRAMNLAIRNIIWELGIVYSIILSYLIISKIVGFSDRMDAFVTGGVSMCFAFYYYGFGFMDYMMERMRMNLQESVKFVRERRGFAVALGSVFTLIFVYSSEYLIYLRESIDGGWLLTLVLIASIILAMLPIITIVAATLGVHSMVDLNKNPYALRDEDLKKTIIENPTTDSEEKFME
ncbi:MAG: EI24 domain-containing protein [Flavobacteriales bacterium]|nr:EI24 domain-containing protein [Flavobacteriales bacterium]MCB9197008.1 EI24 domain-containing protein [Flavobacteriales bacterium]